LEPGDSILFCSDGIIEAQNARYDDFGVTSLMSICNENSSVPPTELLARIFSAVHDFTDVIRQHDDMAALIFRLGSQETPKLPAKAGVSLLFQITSRSVAPASCGGSPTLLPTLPLRCNGPLRWPIQYMAAS
jgi:hypothetical protein